MYLGGKVAKMSIIKHKMINKRTNKLHQWLWFVGLWVASLGCVLIIARVIKIVMKIV